MVERFGILTFDNTVEKVKVDFVQKTKDDRMYSREVNKAIEGVSNAKNTKNVTDVMEKQLKAFVNNKD